MLRHHHAKKQIRQETVWSNDRFDFSGPTIEVARRLIGAMLIRRVPSGQRGARLTMTARIVETEAYLPLVDPSCHAYKGPTSRNASAFGRPGSAYVYFIYGNHFCLNVVTEPAGIGAAVLIRAAEPFAGIEAMRGRRPGVRDARLLSGPGNLCRAMSIDRNDDGVDLSGDGDLRVLAPAATAASVHVGPRIGLSVAREWPLRFFDPTSESVSAHRDGRLVRHNVQHLVDGRARSML
jgi:DNA-3-methyladenine glycosylase